MSKNSSYFVESYKIKYSLTTTVRVMASWHVKIKTSVLQSSVFQFVFSVVYRVKMCFSLQFFLRSVVRIVTTWTFQESDPAKNKIKYNLTKMRYQYG